MTTTAAPQTMTLSPAQRREAVAWVYDCEGVKVSQAYALRLVQRNYEGGLAAFIADGLNCVWVTR